MEHSALVVLTTLGSETEARELVRALLESRCIACGTLLPGGRSLYHWEGSLKEEAVLLKTTASKWEALVAAIRELHPYEVPELLALPVDRGLDSYLSWLTSEVVR